ncbi:PREDICTED: flocculation protein FLO11-like isoform X2 [Tarenaya hassleriana]|uniref:flocculation protein FLO11-like isoform X2 n=1 Tax=Tarenaya hassleriana TaxID=28532 RepID=UPI0008FD3E1A|nr:PREDICTED: flocculation protein FLO11-like isoform X2 [Tarenaya hassleriana]
MPPSPALRSFPARESHKRGHSFGNEMLLQENDDDDLALFKDMESREKQDFLLQSFDDFEASIPKQFSEFRTGLPLPTRGESSELLNSDGENNDYEWLLTPPETPLFPSLDDEPPPVAAASRGRSRSQPISISRSSTMEKSNRSSRGSPSPNRLSPSPRSGNATFQSRERPSSVPRSNPSPSVRSITPSRRPSPPPRKPSPPVQRSSTPISRRPSSVSGATRNFGGRGTSPIRKNQGHSPSPDIRSWGSNIPGFLMDTPPNLRTSIAGRPASYVRGSSPASGNSRDSTARYRRQSTSPTPSRSASSSYSHDRDQTSCQSKCSVASSMDDDSDSLQSGPLGGSECSFSKKVGSFPSNRNLASSKKPSRIISPGSAPKRSFDSPIRHTDHRKSQSMFRSLLSSAPTSSFYIGKSSSNYPIFSRDTSMKTRNATGPDPFATFVDDCESKSYSDAQEDVFAYDKVEGLVKEKVPGNHDILPDGHCSISENMNGFDPTLPGVESHRLVGDEVLKSSDVIHAENETVTDEYVEICSECRCQFRAVGPADTDVKLCPECRKILNVSDATDLVAISPPKSSINLSEKLNPSDAVNTRVPASHPLLQDSEENMQQWWISDNQARQSCLQEDNHVVMSTIEKSSEEKVNTPEKVNQHSVSGLDMDPEDRLLRECLDIHIDSSEAAGISVLLKRSVSGKGPVLQGRTFVASPKPFENLSYTRDSASNLRSSVGYGTVSESSSVDYGPTRQTEPSGISSLSRVSNHDLHALDLNAVVSCEECSESPVDETKSRETGENNLSCSKTSPLEVDKETENNNLSCSESSSCSVSALLEENSVSSVQNPAKDISQEIKDVQDTASDTEKTDVSQDYSREEHMILDRNTDGVDVTEVPASCSALSAETEVEIKNPCMDDDPDLQNHGDDGLQELQFSEPNSADQPHEISESLTVISAEESSLQLDSHGGSKGRSLTLEEATDAILFCSSIVHEIAYKAASTAIDSDTEEPFEQLRPTVTVSGRSNTVTKDTWSRNLVPKRNSKATKTRRARAEEEEKSPGKLKNDENAGIPVIRNVGIPNRMDEMKQPKPESKCNCRIM